MNREVQKNNSDRRGIGLIEAVIASALVTLIFSGLIAVFNFYLKNSVNLTDNIKSEFLAKEALEALRSIRDEDYALLSSLIRGNDYYLYFNGTKWTSTTTPQYVDNFDRRIKVYDVLRDGAGNIAVAGTPDPDTLLLTTTVAWQEKGATTTREISTYLGNIFAQ